MPTSLADYVPAVEPGPGGLAALTRLAQLRSGDVFECSPSDPAASDLGARLLVHVDSHDARTRLRAGLSLPHDARDPDQAAAEIDEVVDGPAQAQRLFGAAFDRWCSTPGSTRAPADDDARPGDAPEPWLDRSPASWPATATAG